MRVSYLNFVFGSICFWAVRISSKSLCACELSELRLKLYVRVSYLNFIYGSMCVWAVWTSSKALCVCKLSDLRSSSICVWAVWISSILRTILVWVSWVSSISRVMSMWAIRISSFASSEDCYCNNVRFWPIFPSVMQYCIDGVTVANFIFTDTM